MSRVEQLDYVQNERLQPWLSRYPCISHDLNVGDFTCMPGRFRSFVWEHMVMFFFERRSYRNVHVLSCLVIGVSCWNQLLTLPIANFSTWFHDYKNYRREKLLCEHQHLYVSEEVMFTTFVFNICGSTFEEIKEKTPWGVSINRANITGRNCCDFDCRRISRSKDELGIAEVVRGRWQGNSKCVAFIWTTCRYKQGQPKLMSPLKHVICFSENLNKWYISWSDERVW